LAQALGLESVEELEAALDAFEGIDEEGVAQTDNLAREARVRSAYLEWCKENGKEADESRFPTFSSNYLAMEQFSQQNGKEMVLNKYADCTEEEFKNMGSSPAPKAAPAATPVEELIATAQGGDLADDSDIAEVLAAAAEAEAAVTAASAPAVDPKSAVSGRNRGRVLLCCRNLMIVLISLCVSVFYVGKVRS
jgi:hypothetical protein